MLSGLILITGSIAGAITNEQRDCPRFKVQGVLAVSFEAEIEANFSTMKVVPIRSTIHEVLLTTDIHNITKQMIQSFMIRSEDITDRGSGKSNLFLKETFIKLIS